MARGEPGGQTGYGGAARRAGFAGCRCRAVVVPNSLQDSGYPADKPVSVQDGVQVSPWRNCPPALRGLETDAPSVRDTAGSHAGLANRDTRVCLKSSPGLDRPSLTAQYHMGKGYSRLRNVKLLIMEAIFSQKIRYRNGVLGRITTRPALSSSCDPATRCENTCRVAAAASTTSFRQRTAPTPLQKRAYELLGL